MNLIKLHLIFKGYGHSFGFFIFRLASNTFLDGLVITFQVGIRASYVAYRMGSKLQHAHVFKAVAVSALEEAQSLLQQSKLKRAVLEASLEKSKVEVNAALVEVENA